MIMVEPTVLNSDVKTNIDIKLQKNEVTPFNCMKEVHVYLNI